jgi:hypothetical protein
MPQTIRIRPETRQKLAILAKSESSTMTKILDKVVEAYRRQRFLESVNADFARLRKNPKLWDQELKERAEWDSTLSDGMKDDG